MALSVKLQNTPVTGQPLWWKEGKIFKVLFTITATGNYVTGGDTLDLTQLFNLASSAPGMNLPTFENVIKVEIQSGRSAPGPSAQFVYQYCQGTTLANGTMQVFQSAGGAAPLAEIGAVAYAGLSNFATEVIQAEAYFAQP